MEFVWRMVCGDGSSGVYILPLLLIGRQRLFLLVLKVPAFSLVLLQFLLFLSLVRTPLLTCLCSIGCVLHFFLPVSTSYLNFWLMCIFRLIFSATSVISKFNLFSLFFFVLCCRVTKCLVIGGGGGAIAWNSSNLFLVKNASASHASPFERMLTIWKTKAININSTERSGWEQKKFCAS